MADKKYIAVDLGAESGRVILGTVTNDKIDMETMHRFPSTLIEENGSLRWDFEKMFSEIKKGIKLAIDKAGGQVEGIGVDSWGVDFGLIGKDGNLVEKPYNYRDKRTDGMMEKAFARMPKREIYQNTGLQFMQLNTLYQLMSMEGSPAIAKTDKLIFIADLVSYFLCRRPFAEYTLASTSQFMDMSTGKWSKAIFDKLNLPMRIMPEVLQPGTIAAPLTPELCKEFNCKPINVIAVGSHDTADAIAAVPAKDGHWAYLSCGTWSLLGIESDKTFINDECFDHAFTNEGGVENTITFLKNIVGLWILQESRRQWEREGTVLDYNQITQMAKAAKPFFGHIDVDHGPFLTPGDMPGKINEYLKKTGQQTTTDKGQIARIILESLAFKYRSCIESIEKISGKKIDVLHIVGGGIQNQLLCQFTSDATGKKVIAGPIEATASGNILLQAKAVGQLKSLKQVRQIVANSFELDEYKPQDAKTWTDQYKKIKK